MFCNLKSFLYLIRDWIIYFILFFKNAFRSRASLITENIAINSQLSLYQQQVINKKIIKPTCTPAFRQLWVIISKLFNNWKEHLIVVKPETVVKWHKKAFKIYWSNVSKRKSGRPTVPREVISIIKKIHKENPLLSAEKIHERLVNLNIKDVPCANTIAKYMPETRKPPSEKQLQSWRTFLNNHRSKIWAIDFFVVPTLFFKVLHVLVIISHDRRKIEHFAVTTNPDSKWLIQQLREATPFGYVPDYIVHDNDPLFRSVNFKDFLKSSNIKSKRTGYKSPWQNAVVERVIGTLRRELLNHIIPRDENHLRYLLREFINKYYNPVRTHQGINCETPIPTQKFPETNLIESVFTIEPILNGLYHSYKKAS